MQYLIQINWDIIVKTP